MLTYEVTLEVPVDTGLDNPLVWDWESLIDGPCTVVKVELKENTQMHKYVYVMDSVVMEYPATITSDGDIKVDWEKTSALYGQSNQETYLWCETCNTRIHAGETHAGQTLAEDWENV